jgi:hypothetical protein
LVAFGANPGSFALTTLVGRSLDLRLAVTAEQLRWKRGSFMRGTADMPIIWG